MKKLLLLFFVIGSLSSCKCKKKVAENNNKNNMTTIPDCFTNAKCTQEILKDSTLVIDNKDVTGKPNYTLAEKAGTTVYRYIMSENQDKQYMDGGYREEIIFELPSDIKSETISGKRILQTKALFGVFCYCKGKAGYYNIQEGTISKTENTITMEIPALVEGQKVRTINLTL